LRTNNIDKARSNAIRLNAVVAFCPLDGLYYVVDLGDYGQGPFIDTSLPLPVPNGVKQ